MKDRRITKQDEAELDRLVEKYLSSGESDLTTAEWKFYDLVDTARELKKKLKRYPMISECQAQLEKEKQERHSMYRVSMPNWKPL